MDKNSLKKVKENNKPDNSTDVWNDSFFKNSLEKKNDRKEEEKANFNEQNTSKSIIVDQ